MNRFKEVRADIYSGKALFSLILIFTVFHSKIFAQTTDSLEIVKVFPSKSNLLTRFNKQLSTFNLNTKLDFIQTWENYDLRLTENFNSTFIKTSEKSIRDEQLFSLQNSYQFQEKLSLGLGLSSSIFSDNRKIEINQASSNQFFLFSQAQPYDNFYFVPFGGYMHNRQVLNDDNGFLYGVEALLQDYTISDLIISSNLKFRNEDISPRKNLIRHYGLKLNSVFAEEVANIISASYSQNRKDFYFEADSITSHEFSISNNIQSRTETNYLLQDRLSYANLFGLFLLDMTGIVHWRTIERNTKYKSLQNVTTSLFDSEINELKLDFESQLTYKSDKADGLFRFLYSERDEKNLAKRIPSASENIYQDRVEQEARKNNNSIRASLSFIGSYRISTLDIIAISMLHNKLKYDTPSEDNFDDRDELLSIVKIRYTRKLTPFFEAFITAEGTYNQTTYIFAEKSSNNNINRILKLGSGGYYKGAKLSSLNNFEVSANYTVYDFEDLNPNIRSYSFRQFTALDSTNYLLSKRIKLSLYGYIKLSEQGDLKWNEFKSRPTRYLQEIYCEPRLSAAYNLIQYSFGLRYFSLSTFRYKLNEKNLDSEFRSIGPIAEILISGGLGLYLRVIGWYEFITVNSVSQKQQTNLNVEMTWNF
ncbi:MAG: hypothetical protein HXY50_04680 [Ignavibacteriaceae bacterium]|nr:hypothetical protein [Ignavibacteriaceae bacterium]